MQLDFSGRLLIKEGLLRENAVFPSFQSKVKFSYSTVEITKMGEDYLLGLV